MKPVLVTGANGHLGNNLCRVLLDRGERVRAMVRPRADTAALSGLDVELVRGDIVDPAATARAVAGCRAVYHAAAGFLMWSRDVQRDVFRPTVEGTRHVLEASARYGVDKVVYTSSLATIGFAASADEPVDERRHNQDPRTFYTKAKIAAERVAFAIFARTGLPVTSIHPGFMLGPRFWKVSESLRTVADFVDQGGSPFYTTGGFGVVDVEDVARGAVLAMEKGRPGERYILAGDNVTVKQLFDLMAELTGFRGPSVRLPKTVVYVAASIVELFGNLRGARPFIDRSQVGEFVGRYVWASSAKAEADLGYRYRPARETLCRTIGWLVEHGAVRVSRREAIQRHPAWGALLASR